MATVGVKDYRLMNEMLWWTLVEPAWEADGARVLHWQCSSDGPVQSAQTAAASWRS